MLGGYLFIPGASWLHFSESRVQLSVQVYSRDKLWHLRFVEKQKMCFVFIISICLRVCACVFAGNYILKCTWMHMATLLGACLHHGPVRWITFPGKSRVQLLVQQQLWHLKVAENRNVFFPHNNMCRELWATNTSLLSENFNRPASSAAHQIKLWWFFTEFIIHTNTEQEVRYRKHIHMYVHSAKLLDYRSFIWLWYSWKGSVPDKSLVQ